MRIVPFEELYYTDFLISESLVKPQNWYNRSNYYSCIGKPKPSHTLLWFKNASAKITDSNLNVIEVKKNQLAYMSKDIQYSVEFFDTAPDQVDTVVLHFQLKSVDGDDITPSMVPVVCLKDIDISMQMEIEMIADEFKKNLVCLPEITSVIYRIFAYICKKQHRRIIKHKYAYIREGINLLESNCDKSMEEIAEICGVSEGYFRRLFREYSGDNPIDFRQKHRIEKAKQMLLLGSFTVGEIAHELHFSDIYHFSKTFKKFVGVSPQNFIKEKLETPPER